MAAGACKVGESLMIARHRRRCQKGAIIKVEPLIARTQKGNILRI
jgi:hypothetical protein